MGSDRGIIHFFTATRNTAEEVGEKWTNEQYGLRSAPSTRRVLRHFFFFFVQLFMHFVDYRGRIFFGETPTKATRNANSSLFSFLPPSADRCRLPLCVLLRQLTLSGFFCQLLSWLLSDMPFLPHFRSRRRSRIQALCLVLRQNRQRDRLLGGPPT